MEKTKGMTGESLRIVITVVVVAIGLVVLWLFLMRTGEGGLEFASEVIDSFRSMLPAPLKWILPGI